MGINGLWQTVSPTAKRQSLQLYCSARIQDGSTGGRQYLRIGVDISTMVAECHYAAVAANFHGELTGGTIPILFNKLATFLKSPATFIFVFDGPGHPQIKRECVIKLSEPRWGRIVQELIQCFGFHIHQAPGEAEAELAMLNKHGLIDAIMSSDSDTLVFGARTILRTIPNHQKQFDDEIDLISSETVADPQGLALSSGGLVLFGMLTGGDYDTQGVVGCGPRVARGLAKRGFGNQLVSPENVYDFDINTMDEDQEQFLADWRAALRLELSTNSQGMLQRREPTLALNIPETFPDLAVLELYLDPLTTPLQTVWNANWLICQPSLLRLTRFCSLHLGWDTEEILQKKFRNVVWEGVILQMLFSPLAVYDDSQMLLATPNVQARIVSATRRSQKGKFALMMGLDPQPRLVFSTATLVPLMSNNFKVDKNEQLTVWPPEHLLPPMLQDYLLRTDPRRKRQTVQRGPKPNVAQPTKPGKTEKLDIIDLTEEDEQPTSKIGMPVLEHVGVQALDYIDLTKDAEDQSGSEVHGHPGRWLGFIDLTDGSGTASGSKFEGALSSV